MSQQSDDLHAGQAQLKTELDAAKQRDTDIQTKLAAVQKQLDDLLKNPPAPEDLSDVVQAIKDDVAEAQTIGTASTTPPEPAAGS